MFINFFYALLLCVSLSGASSRDYRDCIILIDDYEWSENIGKLKRFALMAKLQSAIAEQAAPILLNASLFNLFNERRLIVEQELQQPNSRALHVRNLVQKMYEQFAYWSRYYDERSSDAVANKELVIRKINEEFYTAHSLKLKPSEYQLLLDYIVSFNLNEWKVYKNNTGYYLLVPKKYSSRFSHIGFKIDSLEEVLDPFDVGYIFFETEKHTPFNQVLSDFFITHDDGYPDGIEFYWNIALAGHGGLVCREKNEDGVISWSAGPLIANMRLDEFKGVLAFFHARVHTHFLYYSSCYAGGNHTKIIFDNGEIQNYNYALMCGSLTDSATFSKWMIPLPSDLKGLLTSDDVIYDNVKKMWTLPLKSPIRWNDFFKNIATIDFSPGSIQKLSKTLRAIVPNYIGNIPLLCLPGSNKFFPVYRQNIIKIDQLLLDSVNEKMHISIYAQAIVLLESAGVYNPIKLEYAGDYRFISIKPGDAVHYLKELNSPHYLSLPNIFWQVEFQNFDKKFLIDACVFPYAKGSSVFNDSHAENGMLKLKNVLIMQHKSDLMRMFFTVGEDVMMLVAHKQDAWQNSVSMQEIVKISPAARARYEAYYESMRKPFLQA
jgi:hypothetical protein